MKMVCIEEHWGNQQLEDLRNQWLEHNGLKVSLDSDIRRRLLQTLWNFDERLQVMNEYSITKQVISLSSPGVQGILNTTDAVSTAREINDIQAELISRYPGLFEGFAALPLQKPEKAAEELERAVRDLKFVGAMIHGHTHGHYLDEKQYWPVWERAQALRVPIYLHVNEPLPSQLEILQGYPEMLGPTWSWGVETATHALRVIFSGVFDVFPETTLVLGHLGESLPFLLGRLDEGFAIVGGQKYGRIQRMPSAYLRSNVMVTTSGMYRQEALRCAIDAVGIERVLLATDYPFVNTGAALELFDSMPLTPEERDKICFENAERLLARE